MKKIMKKIMIIVILGLAAFIWFGLGEQKIETDDSKKIEVVQNNPISEADSKEEIKEEVVEEVGVTPKNTYYFTKGHSLKVRDKSSKGKQTDTLRMNTKVEILEEETVGVEKPSIMAKVKYKKNNVEKTGWIYKSELVESQVATLPEEWKDFDFTPTPKKNYASNPKVEVKGIFVSANSIASKKSLERLINLANKTEINAFVIDVKDDDGHLLWDMSEISEKHGVAQTRKPLIKDIDALVSKLKENNIYLIARVVSFKDPIYAKAKPDRTILDNRTGKPFTNADGVVWVSAYDRELWNYNIDVAKEAGRVGFNEVQFDYVRFPASNGGKLDKFLNYRNTKNESKPVAIQQYLKQAYKELSAMEIYTAADVYGQVASSPDDMALGQYWEAVSNYVDYICPMVYPSHYANGVYGTKIADAEPYKVVKNSSEDAVNRSHNIDTPATVRTWIQDFTAPWVKGHIKYGVKEVKEQIRALNDAGYKEYILWNSSNRYSFEKEISK